MITLEDIGTHISSVGGMIVDECESLDKMISTEYDDVAMLEVVAFIKAGNEALEALRTMYRIRLSELNKAV